MQRWLAALLVALAPAWGCRPAPSCRPARVPPAPASPRIDATYDPSPSTVVTAMLELAEVGPDDRVLDLGSGDGRLVITAARDYGAHAVGVEIDPDLVRRSRHAIRTAGLSDRAQIVQGDLHRHPLADATVLMLFLWPSDNLRLRASILAEMPPGARVVSHDHDMDGWAADATREVASPEVLGRYGEPSTIHLWIVPADFAGCWTDADGHARLTLRQGFQVLGGRLEAADRQLRFDAGRARGASATLVARDETGAVDVRIRAQPSGLELRAESLGLDVTILTPCPSITP